jgi:hypothetical protein
LFFEMTERNNAIADLLDDQTTTLLISRYATSPPTRGAGSGMDNVHDKLGTAVVDEPSAGTDAWPRQPPPDGAAYVLT